MKYHDSLILKRNVDSHGNPVSINILDVKQVMDSHSCIVLTQLPDEYYGVNIQGYNEVYDVDKLGALDYKVDYANGVVYFNPINIGKSFSIDYKGTGCELIYASRVATKLDKYGNVVETLDEVMEGVHKVKPTLDRLIKSEGLIERINTDLNKAEIIAPQLAMSLVEGERIKEELGESLATAQDDINTIKAAGNSEMVVNANEWVLNDSMYEKEITHDLNSENIHVSFRNADTKEGVTMGYKIVDKTRILLKSDEVINLSVTLSASYYKPLIATNVDEGEIVGAREGKANLRDNMIRKINYKPFTADRL